MKKVMSPVQSSGPKISLYGVHEDNLAGLLMGLDVWRDHVPAYSSAVIIELYEKSSDYYVRVSIYCLYITSVSQTWHFFGNSSVYRGVYL